MARLDSLETQASQVGQVRLEWLDRRDRKVIVVSLVLRVREALPVHRASLDSLVLQVRRAPREWLDSRVNRVALEPPGHEDVLVQLVRTAVQDQVDRWELLDHRDHRVVQDPEETLDSQVGLDREVQMVQLVSQVLSVTQAHLELEVALVLQVIYLSVYL